ncbi:MAG: penicillin-insensitive murein endopeptidase [Nannocystaceae bacterium]|nr:penicillin-insensitive murein endopeptidase [Nannocystaceae bacterium]
MNPSAGGRGLLVACLVASCGHPDAPQGNAHEDGKRTDAAVEPPLETVAKAVSPASPSAAFEGDAIARELEILDASNAESPTDFLLDLPGSAGLSIDGAADVVPKGAMSVGTPQHGRLHQGIALPPNPALYTRRHPSRSYGSTQTIRTIQTAMTTLRKTKGIRTEVLIGDISLPGGGPISPHVSHQSGRDIDIRLVLAAGLDRSTIPVQADQVDWNATWQLVHSFLETGRVTYVFLSHSRQELLHAAALRAGIHPKVVDRWFQWPQRGASPGIIRHEDGHRAHVHIRLGCAPGEPQCSGL